MRKSPAVGKSSKRLLVRPVVGPRRGGAAVVVREPERTLPSGGVLRAVRRAPEGAAWLLGVLRDSHLAAGRPGMF